MAQAHCLFLFCSRMPAHHHCPRGSHPCTLIDFITGGAGALVDERRRIPFEPPAVVVCQPGHVYRIEQQAAAMHVCVGLRGCSAERIATGAYACDDELARIGAEVRRLAEVDDPATRPRLELLVGLAALSLAERHPAAAPAGIAQRARAVIDAGFARPLAISALAARLHVSADHLHDRFHAAYGEAPARYLVRRRIAAAQELLRGSDLPVQEVARLSGFVDPLYFSRQFHRSTGCSPTRWRALAREHADGGSESG